MASVQSCIFHWFGHYAFKCDGMCMSTLNEYLVWLTREYNIAFVSEFNLESVQPLSGISWY